MNLPKSTRYPKVMKSVHDFILREKINNFPIDPFEIIERNHWGLITYSELAEDLGVTVDEVIAAVQSKDGYTLLDSYNYTIAYNDTVKSPGRIRFTLMHEIGHIELKHLEDFEETILLRSKLTKKQYEILEREANAFARNSLAPAMIVKTMEQYWKKGVSKGALRKNFFITDRAAETRLQMLSWDFEHSSHYVNTVLYNFTDYFRNLFYGKQCTKCKHYFSFKSSIYCPICGHKRFYKRTRRPIEMVYEGIKINEVGRAVDCPRCGNEEVKGKYCGVCNTYLFNKCSGYDYRDQNFQQRDDKWHRHDYGCGEVLEGNARYCHECGCTSTFYEDGLLDYWNSANQQAAATLDISDDDLPF